MLKESNIVQTQQYANVNLSIDRVEEFELKESESIKVCDLLACCFPDYPTDAIYYKQLPSFRYLAFQATQLIGHLGVDFRMINNDGHLLKVLCISDVCVHPNYRDHQIASSLLQRLETDAIKKKIDFLILISNDSKVYYHNGYRSKDNTFKWLMIQNDKSLGVVERKLGKNVIMVKKLGAQPWSTGLTDLLGPIF